MRKTFAACILTAIAVTGCASENSEPTSAPAPAIATRTASADLATGAEDIDAMRAEDITVVEAEAGTSTQSETKNDPATPVTHQQFTTVKAVAGKVSDTFTVAFTGGTTSDNKGKYILELEGQPQFVKGDTYFLVLIGPNEDTEYWVFGGPQGRYELTDETLTASQGVSGEDLVVEKLNGLSVDDAEMLFASKG